jgi:hypothetical protein
MAPKKPKTTVTPEKKKTSKRQSSQKSPVKKSLKKITTKKGVESPRKKLTKKKAVSPLKRSTVVLPAKKQVIKSNTPQKKITPVGTIATKQIHKEDEEENSYKEIDERGQGVLIGEVGDWDDEDFLRVENKIDGKPIYDMTQEELLAVSDTRRVRKPTDHTWLHPYFQFVLLMDEIRRLAQFK